MLSQTEKINYRENSRVWKWADPKVVDPHSIQTYGTHNVFLIVKENGKWVLLISCRPFPIKLLIKKILIKAFSSS